LVDVGLPDGDGFSLTRQLRAKPWTMRVVVFSSDADPANHAAAAPGRSDRLLPARRACPPSSWPSATTR